jgi:hypothetical protein
MEEEVRDTLAPGSLAALAALPQSFPSAESLEGGFECYFDCQSEGAD